MSVIRRPPSRHTGDDESGQALVLAVFSMIAILALASFTVDVGYMMHTKRRLQASADAAAIAGAQLLPASSAVSTAIAYSSVSGQKNAYAKLPGVTMAAGYPLVRCLTSTGLPCAAPANGNALVVRQQVNLPLFFARIIGMSSVNITATATASMRGGAPRPLDLMLVVDTSRSMEDECSAAVSGVTDPSRLDCVLAGVRLLLGTLWPCPAHLVTCGAATNGHVALPLDEVGLMIFPGLKATGPQSVPVSREYDCSNNVNSNNIAAYNASPVYQIVPLSSDFRVSTTATSLNGAVSNLVKAVAWNNGNNCTSSRYGLESPGGVGTFYAHALTAAQAALVASSRTNVERAIILLSDGDAQGATGAPANPCRTAITAAAAAKNANPPTVIYSIAYGASNGGCGNDSPRISSRETMRQIASDTSRFYDQPSAGSLIQIFQRIANDLTKARLLPDDVM